LDIWDTNDKKLMFSVVRRSPGRIRLIARESFWSGMEMKSKSNINSMLGAADFVQAPDYAGVPDCRRLTRLTNAFSKKFENFQAAVALNFCYYNFVKTHGAIRMTPAQAAGVENSAGRFTNW
jgi:hypothetical protein